MQKTEEEYSYIAPLVFSIKLNNENHELLINVKNTDTVRTVVAKVKEKLNLQPNVSIDIISLNGLFEIFITLSFTLKSSKTYKLSKCLV